MKEIDIKQIAIQLRDEVARASQMTTDTSIHEVFMSAESIVSALSFLIGPIADMEQKYRLLVITFLDAGESHAAAEAKAKASTEYKEWRKYSALYELGHEQIMLLKKFSTDLSREMTRS